MSCKDGKIHTLTIKTLKLSDEGDYTCEIGDRNTTATLTVTESMSKYQALSNNNSRHI